MGCNFPEILAWDLEKSEAVFTSKQMTSGTPSPAVAAVDRDLHYNLQDTMSSPDEPSSPCRPRDLKRVRSFRGLRDLAEESEPEMPSSPLSPTALEKQPQQPQHLQQQERPRPRLAIVAQVDSRPFVDEVEDAVVLPWLSEHGPGSSSSSESSPSSFEMAPIPMRRRHQSVTTAATSVTSGRRSSTTSNPQALTSPGRDPAESWVDLESDFADAQAADSGFGTDAGPTSHAHAPTSTLEPAPSISDVASLVQGGLSVPRRRSSLRHCLSPKPPEDYHLIRDGAKRPSLDYTRSETPRSPHSPTFNDRSHYTIAPRPRGGQQVDDQVSSVYNPESSPTSDFGDGEKRSGEYRGSFDLGRKTGSKSPKAVRWNGPADTDVSLDPTVGMAFASPLRSAPYLGASAPPIPLPPDVIETLMVSTACFPETMLLCSSLSIETIRAYSRKLRRLSSPENAEARSLLLAIPSPSSASLPPCTQSPTSPHKRWRLASILPRRPSTSLGSHHEGLSLSYQFRHDRHGQHHHALRGDLPTNKKPARTHYQGSLVCPDFARFKTVFPRAADYLCDALYAHIVAYNYIILLCDAAAAAALANMPSAPDHYPPCSSFSSSPSSPLRRGSATSSSSGGGGGNDDSTRRIPKKAAHLLGLQQGAAGSAATTPARPGTATSTLASIARVHATEPGIADPGGTASGAASVASGRHRRTLTMGSGSIGNRLTSKRRGRDGSTASAPPPSRGGTVPGSGGGGNRAQNGPESEASLRSLRDALGRCVVNLITTVKLTTDGSAPTLTSVPGSGSAGSIRGAGGMMKQDDVDPWLVRALCEMVRCCEDAA
ncbi:hypothetical protein MAPG_02158 [Magnaporthiopsis poae ATCC 64411]|uniref:Uncharacterized protein n=1 Tax=Magnaporthiopsis poae (strain ATCC 64411 / 73-15) TaxID=644358 RepID=A0A0C4DQL4_MAGP6|nr:hypothetical protein MAPG_02158 [Magnaporthiopsis poae ATCC 64411]